MTKIEENLLKIKEQINKAEIKCGRTENSVKLMAVSKFHPVEDILSAIQCGQTLFGENRVQEAVSKFPQIFEQYKNTNLHMIGTLQSNKVKNAVKIASCIQSVDSIELLREIEKQCAKIEKNIDVLFELHTAEDSKCGFLTEEELENAVKIIAAGECPHVTAKGLMTMAPFSQDEKLVRKSFVTLRNTLENANKEFPSLKLTELSMGMSGDFKIAIEEGSTQVRVGTAIFGERDYSKA